MRLLLDTHAFLWWVIDDPRLLIAQALEDDLILVTPDPQIGRYPVLTVW